MNTLVRRLISHLVLISYLTSILRLDYVVASETEIQTVASSLQPQILRLRLQPRPDYEIKVNRQSARSDWNIEQGPGLEIKLKKKGATFFTKKETLASIFLADGAPPCKSTMAHYGLIPQRDDKLGVIGLVWKLNEFPEMNILIVRDGSILVTGAANKEGTVRFSSPYKVHLENFKANSVEVKAQSLELGDNVSLTQARINLKEAENTALISKEAQVSISELSLLKGRFLNQGELRSVGHQSVRLTTGTLFDNQSIMGADI